jgi:DNA-binding transcriptional MocR family regulator
MDPKIQTSRSCPLYQALADEIQGLIENRSLRAGQRLPSVRMTATQRQLSIGTVMQAYVVLENRGHVEARPKSGYYVRSRPPKALGGEGAGIMGPALHVAEKDLAGHMMELSLDSSYFQLGTAWPDPSLLPLDRLSRVAASVGRSDPGIYGRSSLGRSYEPLTQELSRRYLQTGTVLGHEDFIITTGCTESLYVALSAITRPGDVVIVESPAYFGFLRIIAALQLRAVEVPVDPKKGLSLEALRVALDNHVVKAVIVTPSYHNPTGACMTNARKEELYAILCDYDLPAIEDDIYGDLHYGPVRPKPLKAWDRDGRILLCSSLSKTLSPGLNLGWVAAGRYHQQVDNKKWSETSIPTQMIATRFYQEGYDRHVRRIRAALHSQVTAVTRAVRRYFPRGTRVTEPAGGFIFWVEFPAGVDVLRLRLHALEEKIGTAPGPIFSVRDQFRSCLRLNAGLPWTSQFEKTIQTLGRLAAAQLEEARSA